jgi:hypothetical protein
MGLTGVTQNTRLYESVVDEVIMWFRFAGISADRADAIKNFI